MTYKEARAVLEGRAAYGYAPKLKRPKPSRQSVKVANNTWLERVGPREIALRLHSTDVLLFTPHYVELRTGGWYTMTTRDRLCYGPVTVSSGPRGWSVFPATDCPCFCLSDAETDWSGIIVLGDYSRGLRMKYTGERDKESDCPIYEWATCETCGGSGVRRGSDWNSGGHPFYDGIRVKPDGSALLTKQPHRPGQNQARHTFPGYMASGRTWRGY